MRLSRISAGPSAKAWGCTTTVLFFARSFRYVYRVVAVSIEMALPLGLVLSAAKALGIDPSNPEQTYLLSVAKAYLELPLPTSWKRVADDKRDLYFLDRRTSQAHPEHPQLQQLQQIISHLKANPPPEWQQQTSMLISRDDGTEYVHDFFVTVEAKASGNSAAATEAPPVPELMEQTDSMQPKSVEGGEGATAAPVSESNASPMLETTPPTTGTSGEAISSGSRLIPKLPRALLESFGVLPPTQSPRTLSPRTSSVLVLRFYSWWSEDAESTDLSLRVSGDSSVGGGIQRRHMTLEYDVSSKVFSLQR